jgi:hypothetical protein
LVKGQLKSKERLETRRRNKDSGWREWRVEQVAKAFHEELKLNRRFGQKRPALTTTTRASNPN